MQMLVMEVLAYNVSKKERHIPKFHECGYVWGDGRAELGTKLKPKNPAVAGFYIIRDWVEGDTLYDVDNRPMELEDSMWNSFALAVMHTTSRLYAIKATHGCIDPKNIIVKSKGKKWKFSVIDISYSQVFEDDHEIDIVGDSLWEGGVLEALF